MDVFVDEIIDGMSQYSDLGQYDQLDRVVGGPVGLSAQTKIVVLWLIEPAENADN